MELNGIYWIIKLLFYNINLRETKEYLNKKNNIGSIIQLLLYRKLLGLFSSKILAKKYLYSFGIRFLIQ